ncbi:hypothetical protein HJC23_008689 [Cyclotella cryptica]|uniref:Sulfotransferase n=1 Tax=Cyclotella cryptica TaxID=29204 RepID=A0ABD3QHP0_9STRA|eukprot:CCRYP_005395-RA/>CCRYP_005395-RA protein AED:0.08 eAED:0.08 QI:293/1/1/1/0/0/2/110/408
MVKIGRSATSKWSWTNNAVTILVLLYIVLAFVGTLLLFTVFIRANSNTTDGAGNKPGPETSIRNLPADWQEIYKKGSKNLRDWKKNGLEKSMVLTYPGVDDKIADILRTARVEIDEETASRLPTWEDVVSQYGEKPIIHGLEKCETYRNMVKPEDRMIGPAGIFNTGTNLFFQLMKENCDIKEAAHSTSHKEPRKNGIRYQVPWGKHNPVSKHRFKNAAKAWGEGIKQDDVMPFVLIKDPYHWMGSECRHEYLLKWTHSKDDCPNLIDKSIQDAFVPQPVTATFALSTEKYESLVDVWNTWYNEYEQQTFPMIQTRFEDLVFHGEEVLRTACECVGGVFTDNFVYIERNAKEDLPLNAGANGLVDTLIQVGNSKNRFEGFTDREILYANENLDQGLMSKFGYAPPPFI